jgi:predicted  nucleic acid-binding Zn-ribbon protein
LGENTKKEKAINNLTHRFNYFENLILETKVQINELKKDQQEYEKKKEYLREELKDKEDII